MSRYLGSFNSTAGDEGLYDDYLSLGLQKLNLATWSSDSFGDLGDSRLGLRDAPSELIRKG